MAVYADRSGSGEPLYIGLTEGSGPLGYASTNKTGGKLSVRVEPDGYALKS
jgi:hypothetical protein